MTTIFKIQGGGQRVRQNVQSKRQVVIERIENSDWPEKAGVVSYDSYTQSIWATDEKTVRRLASEWAKGHGAIRFVNA